MRGFFHAASCALLHALFPVLLHANPRGERLRVFRPFRPQFSGEFLEADLRLFHAHFSHECCSFSG
uniref:Uncharacterized protein n=1 Tax=mine drainage metagenome TaxID=410659 RepID=E6QP83_9ZZZZ